MGDNLAKAGTIAGVSLLVLGLILHFVTGFADSGSGGLMVALMSLVGLVIRAALIGVVFVVFMNPKNLGLSSIMASGSLVLVVLIWGNLFSRWLEPFLGFIPGL